MNPNTLYLLKFFGFFTLVGIVLLLIYIVQYNFKAWNRKRLWKKSVLLKQIDQSNENLYNAKYRWLQIAIHDYETNRDNYTYIATQLLILYGMKYHNEEKSRVLTDAFNIRFARFKKDNEPDEFSPESVFSEFNDI